LAPPLFIDDGIYFTVILRSAEYPVPEAIRPNPAQAGNQDSIIAALKTGSMSRSGIEAATGLTTAKVRYALEKLMAQGKVHKIGNGSSATTTYTLAQ
jgi:predicted HTH transcriptional regulator